MLDSVLIVRCSLESVVLLLLLSAGARAADATATPLETTAQKPARIVFLGDSITDGDTYPLLVQASLAAAGKPIPTCLNAGIGGDTAEGMLARLDRDVFPLHPTLVSVSAGVNDVGRGVAPETYERQMCEIVDKLQAKDIEVMLLTTSGVRNKGAQKLLDATNEIVRRIARDKKTRLGDVAAQFQPAVAAGQDLWEADGCHLNFPGYRVFTRGVLSGLGYAEVAVPKKLTPPLLPGVVPMWRVRIAPGREPLTTSAVAELRFDDDWKPYAVPESKTAVNWWFDQERQRGYAVNLKRDVGQADQFQAVAEVKSERARRVFFNPGASLRAIWLNGQRIYKDEGVHGWHAGREQIEAELQAGNNQIVIESGDCFFLSITDERQ